eukprot:jgi/Botrbrau1/9949/Bobra.0012s0044.1
MLKGGGVSGRVLRSVRQKKIAATRSGQALAKVAGDTRRSTANTSASNKPKVVIITGPTAVGKTAASIALAHQLGGEIISADSVQVYRGLDIGSDKISKEERQGIPHHLIDILSPTVDFSAGDFYMLARDATAQIIQRGRVPIVVGGTGFYLRWYVHGPPTTPRSAPAAHDRAQALLNQAWQEAEIQKGAPLTLEERWEVATALVAKLGDPVAADKLKEVPNNMYRLLRILEIVLQTGRPLAEMDLDTSAPLDYDFRCFFLNRPRASLYRRIDARCECIVADGLLQEALMLLEEGVGLEQTCASRGIGYRQAMIALSAWLNDPASISESSLEEVVSNIQAATRNLCHRQIKWFRNDPLYRWIDAARHPDEVASEIAAAVCQDTHDPGDVQERGVLSKEQYRELRTYVTSLRLLGPGPERDRLLSWLRDTVGARTTRDADLAARPMGMPDPGAVRAGTASEEAEQKTGRGGTPSEGAAQETGRSGTPSEEAAQETGWSSTQIEAAELETRQGGTDCEEIVREAVQACTLSEEPQWTTVPSGTQRTAPDSSSKVEANWNRTLSDDAQRKPQPGGFGFTVVVSSEQAAEDSNAGAD